MWAVGTVRGRGEVQRGSKERKEAEEGNQHPGKGEGSGWGKARLCQPQANSLAGSSELGLRGPPLSASAPSSVRQGTQHAAGGSYFYSLLQSSPLVAAHRLSVHVPALPSPVVALAPARDTGPRPTDERTSRALHGPPRSPRRGLAWCRRRRPAHHRSRGLNWAEEGVGAASGLSFSSRRGGHQNDPFLPFAGKAGPTGGLLASPRLASRGPPAVPRVPARPPGLPAHSAAPWRPRGLRAAGSG